MAEKKVYNSGDVEELYGEVWDLFDDDHEKVLEVFEKYNLTNYNDFFGEVMAGGLEEELVCTPEWCETFCEGMKKILEDYKK